MRARLASAGFILVQVLATGLIGNVARADDAASSSATPSTAKKDEEPVNARAVALEGSKSPWSGQLQFTYLGSTFNHPFSSEAENPSHQAVPPPVYLQGVVAIRYRFNDTLTAGLGTGVTTETPFQGQKNTTVADPQVDIAKSFTLGPIHNRVDFTLIQLSSHSEEVVYGENQNFDVTSESYYETKWGLTSGLALEYDWFSLQNLADTCSTLNCTPPRQLQLIQDYLLMPYFEYQLSKDFNLRTIWHFTTNMTRDLDKGKWSHPDVTQNLGLGYSASEAVFLYLFGAFDPYSKTTKIAADTTTIGLQAIINLF